MEQSVALPGMDESVFCTDYSQQHALDPGGTALAPDVIVLVELSEPWPKPVGKHADLAPLVGVAAEHGEQVRLLAAVPQQCVSARLISLRPVDCGILRSEVTIGDRPHDDLRALLEDRSGEFVAADDTRRTVLICVQGSHDICCGTRGVELADWAEADLDAEIFRVSHTGGHRFAPTAMTLPDGRMWAYLTPKTLGDIVQRHGDGTEFAALSRGWWGAPTGPAQIAERAVFAELGFDLDTSGRSIDVIADDGGAYLVTVVLSDRAFEVRVGLGREVPTIRCDAPGGLPAKPGHEWVVLSDAKEIR